MINTIDQRSTTVLILGLLIYFTFKVLGAETQYSAALNYISQPYAVAIDTHNAIYVTDDDTAQIFKFSPNGTQIGVFNTTNPRLSYPQGITLDNKSNLYVADLGNSRVVKFAPNGTQIGVFNSSKMLLPKGIFVDVNNSIYVTDVSAVIKLSANGTYLGNFTTRNPSLSRANGIVVDLMGNMYVADLFNSRIVKLSPTGALLQILNISNSQFFPNAIALVGNQSMYVSDDSNARVISFSLNGTVLGVLNTTNPALNSPQGLALDLNGTLYVADLFNHRVVSLNVSQMSKLKSDQKPLYHTAKE